MNVVVDASVAVKWYVPEIHTDIAERLLTDKYELHAPELIWPELGNILWKKNRRGELESDTVRASLTAFKKDVSLSVHSHHHLIEPAIAGALATGQTVYDWMYMALAVSMSANFVTADRRFFLALKKTDLASQITWVADIE